MRTVVFLSPRSRSSTFPSPPKPPLGNLWSVPPLPLATTPLFSIPTVLPCAERLAGRPASPGHRERSGPWPRAGSEGRGAHAAQGLLSATAATPGFTAGVMEATGIPSAAEEGDLNNLKIILATVWEADHSGTKAGKGKPVQRPRQPSGLKAGRRCARW